MLPVLLLFCLAMGLLWIVWWDLRGWWKALKESRGYPLDRLYLILLFLFVLVMFVLGIWPLR
jgi:hypothetical protein